MRGLVPAVMLGDEEQIVLRFEKRVGIEQEQLVVLRVEK